MNWLNTIYSDCSLNFVSNPNPKKGETISIKLRVIDSVTLKGVFLKTKFNGVENLIKLELLEKINGFNYYQTKITYYEDILKYSFILREDDVIYYYNQYGIFDYLPNENYDFKILYDYIQPSWVKESVFYQIFPERFFNGNEKNDVKDNEYIFDSHPTIKIKDWHQEPKEYNESFCLDFYGGDLEGIKEKIPYLKKLGVTALYLNPIFYGATVHKYDCLDFFKIDPHFGGEKALIDLVSELHKNDMKIILDISINHTGISNKWFNKEGTFFDKSLGAYNNPHSKEREYYFFDDLNNYKAWFGVETLPTLNYTSKKLRNIIYKNKNSVLKKYLKKPFNIDGWRFDVADTMGRNDYIQLHHDIWPEIRKSIKEENKDAYILAEDWTDCREFLNGNEWDSSMNYYGFARNIREFIKEGDTHNVRREELKSYKTTAKMFINRLKEHYLSLPFLIQENQFNLFDSHDIHRLHTNPEIDFLSYRIAVITMFTMIGTPNIYYGDEIGLKGRMSVEGCRYPMDFRVDLNTNEYYNLYQKLSELKKDIPALKYGSVKFFDALGDAFGFARISSNDVVLVIGSMDEKELDFEIPLYAFGNNFSFPKKDLLLNELNFIIKDDNTVLLNVKPKECFIIRLENKN